MLSVYTISWDLLQVAIKRKCKRPRSIPASRLKQSIYYTRWAKNILDFFLFFFPFVFKVRKKKQLSLFFLPLQKIELTINKKCDSDNVITDCLRDSFRINISQQQVWKYRRTDVASIAVVSINKNNSVTWTSDFLGNPPSQRCCV